MKSTVINNNKDNINRRLNEKVKESDFASIKKLLVKNGFKITEQRKLILEQFLTSNHLTAEEIHQQLKKYNIGLATVYRNIKIFTDIGIVKEIVVGGVNYYELKIYSKKTLHLHFQCSKCGDIIDIDEKDVVLEYLKLSNFIEMANDLQIYDVDIMYMGLCKNCKEENKWQGQ